MINSEYIPITIQYITWWIQYGLWCALMNMITIQYGKKYNIIIIGQPYPQAHLLSQKWQIIDESEFPWSVREGLSRPGLHEDLEKTLDPLMLYARDVKLTKTSLLTAANANASQFSNSEWFNIIIRAMVDLDHVIFCSIQWQLGYQSLQNNLNSVLQWLSNKSKFLMIGSSLGDSTHK